MERVWPGDAWSSDARRQIERGYHFYYITKIFSGQGQRLGGRGRRIRESRAAAGQGSGRRGAGNYSGVQRLAGVFGSGDWATVWDRIGRKNRYGRNMENGPRGARRPVSWGVGICTNFRTRVCANRRFLFSAICTTQGLSTQEFFTGIQLFFHLSGGVVNL